MPSKDYVPAKKPRVAAWSKLKATFLQLMPAKVLPTWPNYSASGPLSEPPNVLWVADAIAVLQASGASIDWECVVRHALRLRAMLRLRDALVYLRRELDAAVPDEAIRELEAHPPLRREALAHRKAGRSPRVVAPRFLHLTADRSLPAAVATLPTFLRDELGLKRRAQVPLEVVRRVALRMRATRPTVVAR